MNKNKIVEVFEKILSKKIRPIQHGNLAQQKLQEKFSKKTPHNVFANCDSGCDITEDSFFDSPECAPGTETF